MQLLSAEAKNIFRGTFCRTVDTLRLATPPPSLGLRQAPQALFRIHHKRMKPQIAAELVKYKSRMVPFMPDRRTMDKERAFFAIFSAMIGAIEIAPMLPDPWMREKVLGNARDFLLRSF